MKRAPVTCRSCGAPIFWARTEAGKLIPLNCDPVPDGNLAVVVTGSDELTARAITLEHPQPPEVSRYTTHFTNCPHARDWRKGAR